MLTREPLSAKQVNVEVNHALCLACTQSWSALDKTLITRDNKPVRKIFLMRLASKALSNVYSGHDSSKQIGKPVIVINYLHPIRRCLRYRNFMAGVLIQCTLTRTAIPLPIKGFSGARTPSTSRKFSVTSLSSSPQPPSLVRNPHQRL